MINMDLGRFRNRRIPKDGLPTVPISSKLDYYVLNTEEKASWSSNPTMEGCSFSGSCQESLGWGRGSRGKTRGNVRPNIYNYTCD